MWTLDDLKDGVCYLPKHHGETWYDVIQRDQAYVEWLVDEYEDLDDELREMLQFGLKHVPTRL